MGLFYGWVNFDSVIGTHNHYGKVDMYAGTFNGVLREAGVDYIEQFETPKIMATFKAILRDWTNEGFDPFAAPEETGTAFGRKRGDNLEAIERFRIATKRMPGLPDDSPLRDDLPVNRQFADVLKMNQKSMWQKVSRASCTLSTCSNTCRVPTLRGTRP